MLRICDWIILALAAWRLTSLLCAEAGPFNTLRKFREWVGIIHDSDGGIIGHNDSFFAGLLSCFWCTSVWIAAALAAPFSTWLSWLPLALSISAGAIIVEEGIQWLDRSTHRQT